MNGLKMNDFFQLSSSAFSIPKLFPNKDVTYEIIINVMSYTLIIYGIKFLAYICRKKM